MYDDSELIAVSPLGEGRWEVNGSEYETLEAALREVESQMRAYREPVPAPEVYTVLTESQMRWRDIMDALGRRGVETTLEVLSGPNPFMALFEGEK